MTSENDTLALIRQYVSDSQDEQRRADPAAVIQLLQDRAGALATVEKHFDTFIGPDRFWLYSLAAMLLEGEEARSRFYATRLSREDDRLCRILITKMQSARR
jgi:hypothetical protein